MHRWKPSQAMFAVLGVALLSGLVGCESPFEPLAEDTPRSAAVQFLHLGVLVELETSLSRLYLQPGDSVAVTATLRNLGDEDVTFTSHFYCATGGVYVTDAKGRLVYPDSHTCITISASHTLAPGEELSRTGFWDGHVPSRLGEQPARPAIYDIRGQLYWYAPPVPIEIR